MLDGLFRRVGRGLAGLGGLRPVDAVLGHAPVRRASAGSGRGGRFPGDRPRGRFVRHVEQPAHVGGVGGSVGFLLAGAARRGRNRARPARDDLRVGVLVEDAVADLVHVVQLVFIGLQRFDVTAVGPVAVGSGAQEFPARPVDGCDASTADAPVPAAHVVQRAQEVREPGGGVDPPVGGDARVPENAHAVQIVRRVLVPFRVPVVRACAAAEETGGLLPVHAPVQGLRPAMLAEQVGLGFRTGIVGAMPHFLAGQIILDVVGRAGRGFQDMAVGELAVVRLGFQRRVRPAVERGTVLEGHPVAQCCFLPIRVDGLHDVARINARRAFARHAHVLLVHGVQIVLAVSRRVAGLVDGGGHQLVGRALRDLVQSDPVGHQVQGRVRGFHHPPGGSHGGRGRGAVGCGGAHEEDERHAERGSQETFEPGETRVPPEIEQEAADPGEHAQQHEDRGNARTNQARLPVAPVDERMADRVDSAAEARHGRETRGELVDGHGGAPHDVRDHQEHVGQDDVERAAHIAAQVLYVAPQVARRFGALVDLSDAVRPAADGQPFEGTVERERADGRAGRMRDIRNEDDEAQQDRPDPGEHLVDQYAARPAGREKRTRHPYSPILSKASKRVRG